VTPATISVELLRRELDKIIDPCSVRAGAAVGIVTMGLVRQLEVLSVAGGGSRVEITLSMTEPSCLMGWPFAREAQERLGRLAGVVHVEVKLDNTIVWDPKDMAPAYRRRLAARRSTKQALAPAGSDQPQSRTAERRPSEQRPSWQ
jgi:metal-sulfur cluster biosynthetic enzyme